MSQVGNGARCFWAPGPLLGSRVQASASSRLETYDQGDTTNFWPNPTSLCTCKNRAKYIRGIPVMEYTYEYRYNIMKLLTTTVLLVLVSICLQLRWVPNLGWCYRIGETSLQCY